MSLDEERVLMYCFPFYPPSNLTLASFKPFISQFIINDNFIIIIIYIYITYIDLLYMWDYFLCKITMDKQAILSNCEIN